MTNRPPKALVPRLPAGWTLPTALAFLAWFVFAPQCLSTIAVARRETNGWKWPMFMLAYLFALAYIFAGINILAGGRRRPVIFRESIFMAGSVNKVILIGNLGQDPEVKSFQNGGRIANLRIATSENWKDKQTGERKERTEWHTVVLQSDGLVGVAERYLRKGSKVYIEGQAAHPQVAGRLGQRTATALKSRSAASAAC